MIHRLSQIIDITSDIPQADEVKKNPFRFTFNFLSECCNKIIRADLLNQYYFFLSNYSDTNQLILELSSIIQKLAQLLSRDTFSILNYKEKDEFIYALCKDLQFSSISHIYFQNHSLILQLLVIISNTNEKNIIYVLQTASCLIIEFLPVCLDLIDNNLLSIIDSILLSQSNNISLELSDSISIIFRSISTHSNELNKSKSKKLIISCINFLESCNSSISNCIYCISKICSNNNYTIDFFLDSLGIGYIINHFQNSLLSYIDFSLIIESLSTGNKYLIYRILPIFDLMVLYFEKAELKIKLLNIKTLVNISTHSKKINQILVMHEIFSLAIEMLKNKSIDMQNEVSYLIKNFFIKSYINDKIRAISSLNIFYIIIENFSSVQESYLRNLLISSY